MTIALIILGVLLLACVPMMWLAGRAWFKYRRTRVVECPETRTPAAVEVDRARAAFSAAIGEPDLRLASCSRWPERRDCGQPCLSQVEAAPAECLVKTMLVEWYRGTSCALCGTEIGEIHWVEHKPALLTPERKTVEWDEISPESLPAVLATHQRVCWNCHLTSAFRERFPGFAAKGQAV